IYFTDQGCHNSNTSTLAKFNSSVPTEILIKYVVPTGGIAAGTRMVVNDTGAGGYSDEKTSPYSVLSGLINAGTDLNLADAGDQMLVFQSTDAENANFCTTNFTPIFALTCHSDEWLCANPASSRRSHLYPGLTDGVNALAFGSGSGATDEWDNIRYTGITTGSLADLLAAMVDDSNWEGNDVNPSEGWSEEGVAGDLTIIPWHTAVANTNWNVAATWDEGTVPTSSDNVEIPSGFSVTVTDAPGTPAACSLLDVKSGGTLTINAGKALTASGDTDNEGTILIEADATGIGSFIDNGTISGSGTFQMEQYLTGSGGATPSGLFYYVTSPMVSATSNVYNAAGTDRLWNANEVTQSYTEITNNSTALNVTQGYVAREGANGTQTFTGGAYNTGNISASGLTRTGTSANNRGYNLIGNPYPSTVSWDDATRTNLETTMWYRTHNGSSMLYDTYNALGGVGTNNNGGGAVTGDIAPTQAFWVRVDADGNTGSVAFENADRSHGTLAGIYRVAEEEGNIRIALSDGTINDEQIILFNPNASDGYDDYDSQKFWSNNVPQLYSNVNEDTLTINGLNSPFTAPIVPLGMKIPTQGEYTLNASSISFTETPVHLEDTYLGVLQNLNADPVYAFTTDAGNVADRFVLHFSEITGVEDMDNSISVYSFNYQVNVNLSRPSTGTITVLDMAGRMVHTQVVNAQLSTIQLQTTAGIYVVKVETPGASLVRKVFIQ
ncbi:MAG: T9SS type A sorting domain-containing protein, partial [Bacteroidetes bacterium]|nr:T9SS type A sorting domain-containing protein [Bacteroidota bacterium]